MKLKYYLDTPQGFVCFTITTVGSLKSLTQEIAESVS